MGVYHFMGVGRAVGAVTCPIDYIEQLLDQGNTKLFSNSGGINHDEKERGKIEAIVLFTSKDVIDRSLQAFAYRDCPKPGSVRDEITKVLSKQWKRADVDVGRKIYWCCVDIDDYQDCFSKILKVTTRFRQYGKQGKEIWCNLTGGSNSISLSMLSCTQIVGFSNKCYVLSQKREFQQYVSVPPSVTINPGSDNYFNEVAYVKTNVDFDGMYAVLRTLKHVNKPLKTSDLLSRLKQIPSFSEDESSFRTNYMLKLTGLGYTAYDATQDTNLITEQGCKFFDYISNLEIELSDINQDIVAESKEWDWFTWETL